MIFSSMKCSLVLFLGFVTLSAAVNVQYDLVVDKKLERGEKIPTGAEFKLTADGEEGNAKFNVDFNFDISGYKVISTTLYFANADRQITEVVFSDKKITPTKWRKPYNLDTENTEEPIADDKVSPTSASVAIPTSWLPSKITAVSASINISYADSNEIILNYYGIMNFDISLPDTYVIESYKPVNFQIV